MKREKAHEEKDSKFSEEIKKRDAEREELYKFKHWHAEVVPGCDCQACLYLAAGGKVDQGQWGSARAYINARTGL